MTNEDLKKIVTLLAFMRILKSTSELENWLGLQVALACIFNHCSVELCKTLNNAPEFTIAQASFNTYIKTALSHNFHHIADADRILLEARALLRSQEIDLGAGLDNS